MSFWARLLLKIKKPFIIGITGTAGKTTLTKMLGHVLQQKAAEAYVGICGTTIGNLNSVHGLRLSILRKSSYNVTSWKGRLQLLLELPFRILRSAFDSRYPKILVLEYATTGQGHISDMMKFAPPHIAIVTTIGPAHLDGLKTIEGVYKEKRALVQAGFPTELVVLGSGHEFVSRLQADAQAPVIVVEGRGGIALSKNITRAVCEHLGLPDHIIESGLDTFQIPTSRLSRFTTKAMTIIDDSYNANPLSVKLGLDTLTEESSDGNRRRVAMLGRMAELGEQTSMYHREVGIYAKERADVVIGIGEEARDYSPDRWFATSAECADALGSLLKSGDVVLIKGSHSAKMSVIVDALKGGKQQ